MVKNKKQMLLVIAIFTLILTIGSVTYAFFNYTRTGTTNTLKVGRIAFNSTQDNTISLTNMFPTSSTNLNSTNSDTVTINITGDTTYSEGIEYKVTLDQINNTINDKEIPISFNVTASNLGTKDSSYYTNRGGATPIYNLTETGQVEDGKYILVGYIPQGSTGVNGSIDITAFVDADNVAISDTVSRIDNGNLIYGETPGDWIAGRTVFTTSEWNSFQATPISFKVKVEANEGIWVEEPKMIVMKKLSDTYEWYNFIQNVTSIEFSTNPEVPNNALTSFDATDITSSGPVMVYTLDDGLGNGTYKAIICADDVIYAPENSATLFAYASKLVTFNSQNFRVDNAIDLQYMFFRCESLVNIDLSSWNTSNVTRMNNMFFGCSSLTNINSLLNWNVSKVTSFQQMFCNCTSLTNINGLINWNISNVTDMSYVFSGCTNLTNINVLANWDTSNVTNMSNMFQNVNILSYQAFKNWNVSKVQNFSNMFNQTSASTVTTLTGLENWDVSSATYMNAMFAENVNLTDASAINNWNINANINFTKMFASTPVHPEFTQVSGTWDSNGTFTPNA